MVSAPIVGADLIDRVLFRDPASAAAHKDTFYPSASNPDVQLLGNFAGKAGGAIWMEAIYFLAARYAMLSENLAAQGGSIFSKSGLASTLLLADTLVVNNTARFDALLDIQAREKDRRETTTCGLAAGTCLPANEDLSSIVRRQ